ncbi:hypothetical protein B0H14DRAFT_2577002 [Mycena olivaceomarginata]|nr:hypothetical protein B0H14DRAFT_2577002 [Mycena olivaceomarginata]
MPPAAVAQNRLGNVVTCLTMTTNTLEIIADSMQTPFLGAIINTTQAILENIQTVTRHKEDCVQLLEQIHELLTAIVILHVKSDAGGEMPIEVLHHVGKFTVLTSGIRILHKIHTFVEAQTENNRVKSFFRQGGISTLFKVCQAGLPQSFEFFIRKNILYKLPPNFLQFGSPIPKRAKMVQDGPRWSNSVQFREISRQFSCDLRITYK